MKKITLAVSVTALLLAVPCLASADPWKEESDHKHKRDHKEHHKHKKHKHEKEVIYVYEEPPRREVVYVYQEPPRKEVVYVYNDRPRDEVIYAPVAQPHDEVVYAPAERPREQPVTVSTAEPDIGISRGTCNRDAVGTVVGGIAGSVLGYQIGRQNGNKGAGMLVGAIAGAIVGNQVGKNMDQADMHCTAQTLEHARNGQTVTWHNPENGVDYEMTPVDSYQKDNLQCRRYVAVAATGGTREELNREACKQSDGHWEVSDLKSKL